MLFSASASVKAVQGSCRASSRESTPTRSNRALPMASDSARESAGTLSVSMGAKPLITMALWNRPVACGEFISE